MTERKQYIDAVAGLMILWMIIGHLQQVTEYYLDYPNILFFFMPWFYYKAGALTNNYTLREIANRGGGRKFIKPFVVYGLIGQIILVICMLLEHETSLKPYLYSPIRSLILGGTIPGNPPLWFIPSLFVTQCLFAFMRDRKLNIYTCAATGLLGGALLAIINYDLVPVYIGSGILGVFYFAMGRILHKYEGNWKVLIGCVIICAALFIVNSSPNADIRHVAQYSGSIGNFFHGIVMAVCCCFIVNAIFKFLQPLLKFPLLQFVDKHAMDFYVTHWIVLLIVSRLLLGDIFHFWQAKWQFIITGIGCLPIILAYIIIKNQWIKRKVH